MKKLLIVLTIFCSSLLFINKTSALTSDDGYNYVYFKYDYNFLREKVNTPYFNTIIANIKTELENSSYSYYVIYFTDNANVRVLFANGSVDFQGYGNSSSSVGFQFASWEQRRTLSYSLKTGEKNSDNEFVKVSNKTVYTDVLTNVNVNTYNDINDLNPYFAIYDSNVNINTNAWSNKFYLFYDLNKNVLIPHGGHMPLAKNNLESINMSVKKNTISANNKEYVLSEDLTITYNVDDYTKYIYQYKKSDDEDWTNVGIVSNNSITLNLTKNDTIYARILDRNNNYSVVESATMTITDINYQEYLDENLKITFKSKNNLIDNKVASVNLNIDYGIIDNNKYIYLYKKNEDSNWTTVNLTSKSSIDILVNDNTAIIARILDKNTYKVVKQNTMNITNIVYNLSIKFDAETLKDDFGNVYQTNVDIVFNSLNRDLFYYDYRTDYYVLNNQEFWTRLDDDKSNIIVQNRDNINLYARIVNKSTEEVVYTSTYKVIQNIDKPNIRFKTFNNLEYKNGKNYVTSVTLTIDFGLIDNDKYVYQYKKSKDSVWTTLNLFNNNTDIEITENDTIYARVLDYNTGDVITSATMTITSIYEGSYLSTTNDFISTISKYISSFFGLFSYFFNGLNSYIRNCIIALFTIIIMCAIIKNLRK